MQHGLGLTTTFAWRPDQRSLRGMLRTVSNPLVTALGTAISPRARRRPDLVIEVERSVAGPLRTVPALTIFGQRSDPFGFQVRLAGLFAVHEGLVIDKGNHFPMMDDPELFAATVADWWDRHSVVWDSGQRSGLTAH